MGTTTHRSRGCHFAGKRLRPFVKYERLWKNTTTTDEDLSFPTCFSTLIDEYKDVPNIATILLDRRVMPYIKTCSQCAQTFLQAHEEEEEQDEPFCCEGDTNVLDAPSNLCTIDASKRRYPLSSVALQRLRRMRASLERDDFMRFYDDATFFPNTLEDCFGWNKSSCYYTTYLRLTDASNFVTTVDNYLSHFLDK